jgi:hypothetical protein
MMASNDDSDKECTKYPFWYAQVLGIFHADIFLSINQQSSRPKRMEFLWVRWLGQDPTWKSGFKFYWLDHIGFVPHEDEDAFGFLDPAAVIHTAHLIPAFAHGRTINLCPLSVARDDEGDWEYFYVNRYALLFHVAAYIQTLRHYTRFVDRDMLMRHLGMGVGHKLYIEKYREDPTAGTEDKTNMADEQEEDWGTQIGQEEETNGMETDPGEEEDADVDEGIEEEEEVIYSDEGFTSKDEDMDSADELTTEDYKYSLMSVSISIKRSTVAQKKYSSTKLSFI